MKRCLCSCLTDLFWLLNIVRVPFIGPIKMAHVLLYCEELDPYFLPLSSLIISKSQFFKILFYGFGKNHIVLWFIFELTLIQDHVIVSQEKTCQ